MEHVLELLLQGLTKTKAQRKLASPSSCSCPMEKQAEAQQGSCGELDLSKETKDDQVPAKICPTPDPTERLVMITLG